EGIAACQGGRRSRGASRASARTRQAEEEKGRRGLSRRQARFSTAANAKSPAVPGRAPVRQRLQYIREIFVVEDRYRSSDLLALRNQISARFSALVLPRILSVFSSKDTFCPSPRPVRPARSTALM